MNDGRPRVVAIMAAFNEADILGECVRFLRASGVDTYVLDDGSTDGSLALAQSLVGHGVIGVESIGQSEGFSLTRLLHRKEVLAGQIDADWFINQDADEFRDAPWPGVTLADAIARVDGAGFNAIDCALLDFWPTSPDSPVPESDPLRGLTHFEPGRQYNRRQIRCWKRTAQVVDLVSTGGHEARFADRRVFPLRFLLRHYPIRSDAHGLRKVHQERLPRFSVDERARGWHIQYDELSDRRTFVRDPATLIRFDPVSTRLDIALDDVLRMTTACEAAVASAGKAGGALAEASATIQELTRQLEQAHTEYAASRAALVAEIAAMRTEIAGLGAQLRGVGDERDSLAGALALERAQAEENHAERQALASELATTRAAHAALEGSLREVVQQRAAGEAQLAAMTHERDRLWDDVTAFEMSRTWRWTRWLRRAAGFLGVR